MPQVSYVVGMCYCYTGLAPYLGSCGMTTLVFKMAVSTRLDVEGTLDLGITTAMGDVHLAAAAVIHHSWLSPSLV